MLRKLRSPPMARPQMPMTEGVAAKARVRVRPRPPLIAIALRSSLRCAPAMTHWLVSALRQSSAFEAKVMLAQRRAAWARRRRSLSPSPSAKARCWSPPLWGLRGGARRMPTADRNRSVLGGQQRA